MAEVAGHIEWAQARLVRPSDLAAALTAAGRRPAVPLDALAAVFARYEHEKTRRGLVDFDDLLLRCAEAMDVDPRFAAAQRWRWRHLFVDEFQDLNPLQYRLLNAWLGASPDLCVVGDPNQAIYGWNGADSRLLEDLPSRWPSTAVVRLDCNHRSTPEIVAAAASVLERGGSQLEASRPEGRPVEVRAWEDGDAEASGVAAALRRAHGGGRRWSDLAVLVRTNAQATEMAAAIRGAGVPVRVSGAGSVLEHPAVVAALAELGRAADLPVATAAADLRSWAAAGRVPGPAGAGADDDGTAALSGLADLARQTAVSDASVTVGAWLRYLPAECGRDADRRADAVTVCSFHRAKGLEWAEVWVCGLESGLVPIGHARTDDAVAEERRLLYVALSRPSEVLHCSWARLRRLGGRPVPREPSPWIGLLPSGPVAEGPDTATWLGRFDGQRARLRTSEARITERLPPGWPPADPDVLDRLRTWRAGRARASAVPARVVLHDTTLVALASLRPRDAVALLRIPGIGPLQADRYGPVLLDLVAPCAMPA